MTTFYYYSEDGTITPSMLDPKAQDFTRGLPDITSHGQKEDIVGAYLARCEMAYPTAAGHVFHRYPGSLYQQWSHPSNNPVNPHPMERSHWPNDEHESSGYPSSPKTESASTLGFAGWASHSGMAHPYPNPEDIRHAHTLHSLLPYLQPERKLNALNGPIIDIVEEDTGVMFAYQVPKKLLVLFLGRKVVNKFIRTTHREDDQRWTGAPTCQEMNLPCGKSSKSAIRVLISWMIRACQYHTMGTMKQIRVPKNTFVACSLAQTMELFNLHKDALRVDHYIAQTHFVRPIFTMELEALWNCLGEENRHVYAAIKVVGKRLQQYEASKNEVISGIDDHMYALLKEYPKLEARMRDLELNERHRPSFSTDWTKKLDSKAQKAERSKFHRSDSGESSSSSKRFRDYWPQKDINKSPSPVDVDDATRRIGVLRIVSEDTKQPEFYRARTAEPDYAGCNNVSCNDEKRTER
ncbi:hypothetical protein DDE82_005796 [Stemphylium lycopersici]|nr:hypothetical protein TW65_01557 [Stemphylium lycopersici]RAR02403.1 hypothetical protein DDE82_005796 [Stemphylium lycopersici]